MAISRREYAQDGIKYRILTENVESVGYIEIQILEVDGKKISKPKDRIGFIFRKKVKSENNQES